MVDINSSSHSDPFEDFRRKKKQEKAQQRIHEQTASKSLEKKPSVVPAPQQRPAGLNPQVQPIKRTQDEQRCEQRRQLQQQKRQQDIGGLTTDRFSAVESSNTQAPQGFENHRAPSNTGKALPPKPDLFQRF